MAALLMSTCGARDPLARVRRDYPGASEFLVWKRYLLIRYPYDPARPTQRAVLLEKSGRDWTRRAESEQGFNELREVITYIPELDESGVATFKLR